MGRDGKRLIFCTLLQALEQKEIQMVELVLNLQCCFPQNTPEFGLEKSTKARKQKCLKVAQFDYIDSFGCIDGIDCIFCLMVVRVFTVLAVFHQKYDLRKSGGR